MHNINGSNTKENMKDMWRTPKPLFDYLDNIYNFNLDAYANEKDKLCSNYIGENDNAHIANWGDHVDSGPVVAFCNPPYSQPNIKLCLEAARREARKGGTAVVLIPNQPSKYWAWLVEGQADLVLLTMGRISFIDPISVQAKAGNAGGSAIIVYGPRSPRVRKVNTSIELISVDELMDTHDG